MKKKILDYDFWAKENTFFIVSNQLRLTGAKGLIYGEIPHICT